MLEQYKLHIFLLNWGLVIVDAALGYRIAPLLVQRGENADAGPAMTAESIRRLLTFVVALYMFFNCLAYFRGMMLLLAIVSGVVLLDIAFQLIIRWKRGSGRPL